MNVRNFIVQSATEHGFLPEQSNSDLNKKVGNRFSLVTCFIYRIIGIFKEYKNRNKIINKIINNWETTKRL